MTSPLLSQTDSNTDSLPLLLEVITQYGIWAQTIVSERTMCLSFICCHEILTDEYHWSPGLKYLFTILTDSVSLHLPTRVFREMQPQLTPEFFGCLFLTVHVNACYGTYSHSSLPSQLRSNYPIPEHKCFTDLFNNKRLWQTPLYLITLLFARAGYCEEEPKSSHSLCKGLTPVQLLCRCQQVPLTFELSERYTGATWHGDHV